MKLRIKSMIWSTIICQRLEMKRESYKHKEKNSYLLQGEFP